ncbi:hypothetical protein CYMTET_32534 [Cymbomonas tetramitiformis]|uniref:Calcium-regulated actin-bundling protein C-terminal domain-containing protein n=1 Tax=Cymbomonas tetramitiformis TaxID=36881 RepID=A0AAE0FFH7_9CHLO|nr:hypothetical protein CYMTET_32534 [Cymbomonas tetramitiformis]|eukprot:gene18522-22110_t
MASNHDAVASDEYKAKFAELNDKECVEQARVFLRAFIKEFQGKFQEVLDLCGHFEKKLAESGSQGNELEKAYLHQYLETHDETLANVELVDALKKIDLNMNNKTSFLEYLLFRYKKTVVDLLAPMEEHDEDLMAALNAAIAAHRSSTAVFEDHETKIKELEALVEQGGVKGMKAKHELAQLKERRWTVDNRAAIQSKVALKKTEKAVEDDSKAREAAAQENYEAEQQRLADEKAAKDAEEKAARDKKRAAMAERAAMFEGK